MAERIRPKQFFESEGVADWRVVGEGACAHFRVSSFAEALRFVSALGGLEGLAEHKPDVDIRHDGVTVRVVTIAGDYYGMTSADVDLARNISTVARDLGLVSDPSAIQTIQIAIDALNIPDVLPFWRAVLGYRDRDAGGEDLIDPQTRGSPVWFQQMDEPRTERNRIHFDVFVPYDEAEKRVAAALAAGGWLVSDANAPFWWTLADPEGNEVDIATTHEIR